MNEYYYYVPTFDDYRQQPAGQFLPIWQFTNWARRIEQLERNVERLNRQLERVDRRLDRIERRLGLA
ncbi:MULTISPECIES: hypothetical protein [Geobacillus]|jgi:hypothetical protein|uniref:Uncharacterized protein n=1 Tax=Geobacillus thermodenitrificans TaxID=33940 RepID=A0ABY9QE69_GEOTD|nr:MULTISPECIES: hypothetical protein [Geobacillus]ARA98762.1 hypothetical protein GD3902_12465 [Geobacillus thermodenitrificans]ARP43846.1 hypothetical protein GTHT12_02324 [Geobacillus thermodenitrificans]ATO38115.1 hypothetical protein GTID1_13545 [Geobacillus thermodenitrificans]KQB92240.1 hypothetical protein GEPA3_2793 [Geobacillus sp. PA-3]MED0662882.1 hypothetical protein [Geobacillus thermodenitrificans]